MFTSYKGNNCILLYRTHYNCLSKYKDISVEGTPGAASQGDNVAGQPGPPGPAGAVGPAGPAGDVGPPGLNGKHKH